MARSKSVWLNEDECMKITECQQQGFELLNKILALVPCNKFYYDKVADLVFCKCNNCRYEVFCNTNRTEV